MWLSPEGILFIRVYARPEWQMYEDTTLKNVAIFLLECLKAKKHINPYPLHDVPWGPGQSFFDFKMKLINQVGPVIVTWGGKRKLVLETASVMLITQQVRIHFMLILSPQNGIENLSDYHS
ncbi:UNVERIFIED_CONTAM: hypothetical protein NCL1_54775 [Trichonephila clavipes]